MPCASKHTQTVHQLGRIGSIQIVARYIRAIAESNNQRSVDHSRGPGVFNTTRKLIHVLVPPTGDISISFSQIFVLGVDYGRIDEKYR